MALCITARQQEVLEYYQSYFKKHGVFPNTNDAARYFKMHSPAVLNVLGALFLKGAFTDGKPLTSSYKGQHRKAKPAKLNLNAPPHSRPKPPTIKPDAAIDAATLAEVSKLLRMFSQLTKGAATLQE
jgi:hypothetical protein